jgi:hypothetical protein
MLRTGRVRRVRIGVDPKRLGMLANGACPLMDGHAGLSNPDAHVTQGTALDLGYATGGKVVTFYIQVTSGSTDKWCSDILSNSDGTNHIHSTASTPTTKLPGTTFISFEDLPNTTSDDDYNDTSFVISGVTGLVGFMASRRRG